MTDEEKIWNILKDECVTCNYPEKVETGTKCEDCCFRETNPNSKATWNVEPIFDYELNDIYAFFQNERGRNWYKDWIKQYVGTTVQNLYKEYGKHPDEKFSMDEFIKYLEEHQNLSDEKLAKSFFNKSRTFMYNWIKRRFNSTLPKLRQLVKKGD